MPRKKYYKKRNYRKKKSYYNYNNNDNYEFDPITWGIVLLVLFSTMTYFLFIKPYINEIILFLKIFIPILIVAVTWIWYHIFKKRQNEELEKINNTPNFLLELEDKIKEFKPLRKYSKEELYQTWLYWYLQSSYPELEIEKSIEYSRPDIIIDNIAIEIKWPTNMSWLKTLPDKINSYIPKRDYLFIVLFDIKIVSDPQKSEEIYQEKKQEILDNIVESKKDKVIFVEM